MTIDQLVDDHKPLLKELLTKGSVQVEMDIMQLIDAEIADGQEQISFVTISNLSHFDASEIADIQNAGFKIEAVDFAKNSLVLRVDEPVMTVASNAVIIGDTQANGTQSFELNSGNAKAEIDSPNNGTRTEVNNSEKSIYNTLGSSVQ